MEIRQTKNAIDILLYIPNIIGYFRLVLLVLAYFYYHEPATFLIFYGFSISLDFFDGWAARTFKQQSSFGAWLDVVIDNLTRSLLWSNIVQWGWIIVCIEWITFVGNHQTGAKWRDLKKSDSKEQIQLSIPPPYFVLKVMEKGFKTPLGTLVILGLHVLPVWIYMWHFLDSYIPFSIKLFVLLVLAAGRLICLAVESWCIQKHIREILWEDQIEVILN